MHPTSNSSTFSINVSIGDYCKPDAVGKSDIIKAIIIDNFESHNDEYKALIMTHNSIVYAKGDNIYIVSLTISDTILYAELEIKNQEEYPIVINKKYKLIEFDGAIKIDDFINQQDCSTELSI
jgi:hypothetical protein